MEQQPKRKRPFWFLYEYELKEGTGNIWGWKFSLIGLAFMSFLGAIAIYRHIALDVPFEYHDGQEKVMEHPLLEEKEDTTKLN